MKKIYFLIKNILRYPIDRLKGNNISLSASLSSNVLMSNTTIGKGTYIACNTVFNNTVIGNYCSIAPGVQIGGMQHSYWWFSTSPRLSHKCISNLKTNIGNDVWIGAGAIIKQGTKIGDGAVVGAMSFVNKDIPENTIYFGSPAKFFKKRLNENVFAEIKKSGYWNEDQERAKDILRELEKNLPLDQKE